MAELELPEGAEVVRASSLPTFIDCERRWLGTSRKQLLQTMGYSPAWLVANVGAHVGSAAHAGVARSWQGKFDSDAFSPIDEADDAAVEVLRDRITDEGVSYDDVSPSRNEAEHAARRIIRAYRDDAPVTRRPRLVEAAMTARFRPNWYLSGHCDLFADPDATLDDTKTGKRVPSPEAQIGAYGLLLLARKEKAERYTMTFVRRVRRSSEQPPPMTLKFDPGTVLRQARRTVDEIATKTDTFMKDGDPTHFRANTSSVLCSRKYCPLFKTAACKESMWKPED
jgi:hypothetical protein